MSFRAVAAVALIVATAVLIGCARKPPEPVKTPPPPVVVDYPVAEKVNDYEDFAGRTESYKVVELKSRVTGYLKKIHFRDGQDIEEGKPLFDIDDRVYRAELGKANAALSKAQKHLRTTTENFQRVKTAVDSGVEGKEKFDLALGDKLEAEADVEAATAAAELAETNLHFCRIHAPFEGRLSKRMVDEDNLIKADETLLTTIVRLDQVYATFDIDERTVMRVRRLIQKGEVTSSREQTLNIQIALADEDDFSLSGEMVFSDNQLDSGTGTLRVRALITNPRINRAPGYMISPGMFVRVRVPIGPPRGAILVPEKAIGSDQGQRFVFVVKEVPGEVITMPDGKEIPKHVVDRRNVRVGQQYGQLRVIEGGVVATTDRIIVEGLLRVRQGAEVNPQQATAVKKSAPKTAIALPAAPPPHDKK